MPAALPADWPGIRLLYAQGSTLEELSASTGIALGTLCARSAREGWRRAITEAAEAKQARVVTAAVQSGQMQARAIKALDVHSEALADDSRETRLSLSKAAKAMAKEAETAALARAADVLQAGKVAALVHGWDSGAKAPGVAVNILIGPPPV